MPKWKTVFSMSLRSVCSWNLSTPNTSRLFLTKYLWMCL